MQILKLLLYYSKSTQSCWSEEGRVASSPLGQDAGKVARSVCGRAQKDGWTYGSMMYLLFLLCSD